MNRPPSRAARWATHLGLGVIAVVTLLPMLWLVAASLKSRGDFFAYTFLPPLDRLTLDNFRVLFTQQSFASWIANSLFITGITVLIQVLLASLGGFALAKYRFRGQGLITGTMLLTMMLPGQLLLAPMYEQIHGMGLMDSRAGLVVPSMVSVFGMFLFRQAMQQVPDELLEAARIDGCGELGLWWNVVMPVVRPMTGAFCLVAFMGSWNSFLWPQLILHSQSLFTLPIALAQMKGVYSQDYGVMMAGTLLSILPVLGLFLLLQREFISGLTAGAVKG